MSFTADALYRLLPEVHRLRDAAEGEPLRQLIERMASAIAILEDDLEQLYDNHFVETAEPWALPYLGDLLGLRDLPSAGLRRSPRAEVGHAMTLRRRKGTAAMAEMLARDLTGWPARAVEFFERLAVTQHAQHPRPQARAFASLRNSTVPGWAGPAFEPFFRTAEVRRIGTGQGRWNLPNVGIFVWRLRADSRTASPMVPSTTGDRHFHLHPLGLDAGLFHPPETEVDPGHLAEPANLPLPITRRRLITSNQDHHPHPELYGPGRSLVLEAFVGDHFEPIDRDDILVAHLGDVMDDRGSVAAWSHATHTGAAVLLDPELGRVVFRTAPRDGSPGPRVTCHFGRSHEIGGGEYRRSTTPLSESSTHLLVPHSEERDARSFDRVAEALRAVPAGGGSVNLTSSGRFAEDLPDLEPAAGTLEIRATHGACPVVALLPRNDRSLWTIRGRLEATVVLDGLWIAGAWRLDGDLGRFVLRHCTLTPNRTVGSDGRFHSSDHSHLRLESIGTEVVIENAVLPALRVAPGITRLHLRNCIIDAGSREQAAISNLNGDGPAGTWHLENCTIIGRVLVERLELASNCLFVGATVFVERRQEGCVRYSWIPPGSRVPRRHRCLPRDETSASLTPQFTSLRFGHPGYAQLSPRCPTAILRGADDESEMGAGHDLFQFQRTTSLLDRLRETLQIGLEAGIIHAS